MAPTLIHDYDDANNVMGFFPHLQTYIAGLPTGAAAAGTPDFGAAGGFDANAQANLNTAFTHLSNAVSQFGADECPIGGVPRNKDIDGKNKNTSLGLFSWLCANTVDLFNTAVPSTAAFGTAPKRPLIATYVVQVKTIRQGLHDSFQQAAYVNAAKSHASSSSAQARYRFDKKLAAEICSPDGNSGNISMELNGGMRPAFPNFLWHADYVICYMYLNTVKNVILHKSRLLHYQDIKTMMLYVNSYIENDLFAKITSHYYNVCDNVIYARTSALGVATKLTDRFEIELVKHYAKYRASFIVEKIKAVYKKIYGYIASADNNEKCILDLIAMATFVSAFSNIITAPPPAIIGVVKVFGTHVVAALFNSLGGGAEPSHEEIALTQLSRLSVDDLTYYLDSKQGIHAAGSAAGSEISWKAFDKIEAKYTNSDAEGYYDIQKTNPCHRVVYHHDIKSTTHPVLLHRILGVNATITDWKTSPVTLANTWLMGYGQSILSVAAAPAGGPPIRTSNWGIAAYVGTSGGATFNCNNFGPHIVSKAYEYVHGHLIATLADPLRGGHLSGFPSVQSVPDAYGDPEEILFASLGTTMRHALTEVYKNNIKLNVINTIGEVPLRMKEIMKANLPIFYNMFGQVRSKADFLKGLLKIGVEISRPDGQGSKGSREECPGVSGRVGGYETKTFVEGYGYYMHLLDKISLAAASVQTTATQVLNELNDAPHMMETHENSIVDYKNANNTLPYMPLSHVTHVLAPKDLRNVELGYPVHGPGSEVFAFNYGTRLVLHRADIKPVLEHMPGMSDILEKYNMTTQPTKKMEKKSFEQYISRIVGLARYVFSIKRYSTIVGADRDMVDNDLYKALNVRRKRYLRREGTDCAIDSDHTTIQMTKKLAGCIELTSSTNAGGSKSEVVKMLHKKTTSVDLPASRYYSMIYNILDLNISPINVHAMRREIPLANLYNYAYTFDSFVSSVFECSAYDVKSLKPESTTHEVLTVLCKHPYANIPENVYYNALERSFRGTSSVDISGRPKFISDQLWNKALFGEIASNPHWDLTPVLRLERKRRRGDADLGVMRHPANRAHILGSTKNTLSYIKHDPVNGSVVKTVNVGSNAVHNYLKELGRIRFDTTLSRNMFFLANVQRIMTYKINKELTKAHFPVTSGPGVVAREVTEYNDLETYDDINVD